MTKEKSGAKLLIIAFACAQLISGCASNQYSAIKAEEKAAANSNVQFSIESSRFQVVIDKNDRILNVCNMQQVCEGQSDFNNETIYISSNEIGLAGYGKPKTPCGVGILGQDSNPKDERACNSRFYKTSNMYVTPRVVYAIFTLGVGTLMMGTLHQKSFDLSALKEASFNAHIQDLQTLLFSSGLRSQSLGTMKAVYVDLDNIDKAYQDIQKETLLNDSLVLLDKNTHKPLYVFNLAASQANQLPVAVNKQLSEFLATLVGRSVSEQLATGMDIKKLIPPIVALPILPPPIPQIIKSEYETKAAFAERVRNVVEERESVIHELQKQYEHDVQNRNQYIAALSDSWQEYLDEIAGQQNALVKKVRKNQTQLARLLYVMNWGKFSASDISYDAENEYLYFTTTSLRYGFKQKMMAKMKAATAKLVKESRQYSLTPTLNYQDGKIKMDGLILTETGSGSDFSTSYTDINFMPEYVGVRVATSSEKIIEERSALFRSYQQKPQALVDTNSQVWYFETRNSINAKKPSWYTTPESSQKVISYGEGNTHEEAMLSARGELASTIKTTIFASTEVLKQDNTFRTYQDASQHVRSSTEVELKAGDYSVYKQDEMDGKHYVALCYRCNVN